MTGVKPASAKFAASPQRFSLHRRTWRAASSASFPSAHTRPLTIRRLMWSPSSRAEREKALATSRDTVDLPAPGAPVMSRQLWPWSSASAIACGVKAQSSADGRPSQRRASGSRTPPWLGLWPPSPPRTPTSGGSAEAAAGATVPSPRRGYVPTRSETSSAACPALRRYRTATPTPSSSPEFPRSCCGSSCKPVSEISTGTKPDRTGSPTT